jgi:hypothetical protein
MSKNSAHDRWARCATYALAFGSIKLNARSSQRRNAKSDSRRDERDPKSDSQLFVKDIMENY